MVAAKKTKPKAKHFSPKDRRFFDAIGRAAKQADHLDELRRLQIETATHVRDQARHDAISAAHDRRPSIFLGATVGRKIDLDGWYAEHDGVIATGATPHEATLNFDRVWMHGYRQA
jgi:hypothetical protein